MNTWTSTDGANALVESGGADRPRGRAPRRAGFDEAANNAAFRNLLAATLPASRGPQAVAAIVDKRLGTLEKAKGTIGSGRVRDLVEDLSATLKIIAGDLAKVDPDGAVERLLRLVATADRTIARAEGGADADIAPVCHAAAAALPALLRRLSSPDTLPLADRLYALAASSSGAIFLRSAPEIFAAAPPDVVGALGSRLRGGGHGARAG
jgi:hypothetical protein